MSTMSSPPYESPIAEDLDFKGKTAKVGAGWLRWLNMAQIILEKMRMWGEVDFQQPSTGFDITVADGAGYLILDPSAALANGTVRLPEDPVNKQQVQVSTTQAIAALTVTAASGTVKNPPTTLAAGAGFGYYYRSSNTTWYRMY